MIKLIRRIVPYVLGALFASIMYTAYPLVDYTYEKSKGIIPSMGEINYLMQYSGGIKDKSERWYSSGKNWIIVKDYPENIEKHKSVYQTKTDELWDRETASIESETSATKDELYAEFLRYMPVVHSNKGTVISNRTERYYHRGPDWIMMKDFPDHIDSYEATFEWISEELWTAIPEVETH